MKYKQFPEIFPINWAFFWAYIGDHLILPKPWKSIGNSFTLYYSNQDSYYCALYLIINNNYGQQLIER